MSTPTPEHHARAIELMDRLGILRTLRQEQGVAQALADAEAVDTRELRAKALEDAADRSQERVGINPLWLRDDAKKIRQGAL